MRKNQYFLFKSFRFNQGFTLIELIVVVVIVANSCSNRYAQLISILFRKGVAAEAQQEMAKLSEQLQRYKSRNFSYKGFNASYLSIGGQTLIQELRH